MADIYRGIGVVGRYLPPNTFLFLVHNNDPGTFIIQSLINNPVSSSKEFAYSYFHFSDKLQLLICGQHYPLLIW